MDLLAVSKPLKMLLTQRVTFVTFVLTATMLTAWWIKFCRAELRILLLPPPTPTPTPQRKRHDVIPRREIFSTACLELAAINISDQRLSY